MWVDITVLIVYFVFLAALGWAFRSAAGSTSEYFRGGGRMLWWMVGSTSFMMALSAMTFTGLMGKALVDGMSVGIVFFANATGYFINYLFFAAKARQMRVISPVQGIRLRFGKLNEQVFTWANIPVSVLQAGIWLNGLAVFTSAVIDVNLNITIIVTGLIVLFMSLVGGSWAVIASDVMQMVIITIMTFVTAMVAIFRAGGIHNLLESGLPVGRHVIGAGYSHAYLFVAWALLIFIKQFFSTNNMVDSYRYIAAKDTSHARKAALLACVLSCIGPLIWFLPAWFVAGHYPNPATWNIHGLGKKITDATYYVFVKKEMPVGMVGLMLAAMFAATMSSMDSALNRNAGIILKSVYEPYFCKDTSEKNLMKMSQILTLVFGIIIILAALFLTSLKQFGLFDLMMLVGTLIGLPLLIPSIMCFFVRKTPDWAGWGTIAVGVCVSALIAIIFTQPHLKAWGFHLSDREFSEAKSVTCGVLFHGTITLPFFCITRFFYKEPVGARKAEIEKFFDNTDTPIVVTDTALSITMDNKQNSTLGKMLIVAGLFVCLLMLVPQDELWERFLFLAIAGMLILIGAILVLTQRKISDELKQAEESQA